MYTLTPRIQLLCLAIGLNFLEWNLKNTMFVIVLFFYEIREKYHCLFKQGLGPLCIVMEYRDQQCLGLFLLELKRRREKLLTDNTSTQAHQQRTTTAFFSPHLSYSCYKSIEGYTNGIPTRTLQKGYDRASNSNL